MGANFEHRMPVPRNSYSLATNPLEIVRPLGNFTGEVHLARVDDGIGQRVEGRE